MPRHRSVREFRQEHGYEPRQAPLCSQLVWPDSCQPKDVLWDVRSLALKHSTLPQTQSWRSQAAEASWDGHAHAGEESTPSR